MYCYKVDRYKWAVDAKFRNRHCGDLPFPSKRKQLMDFWVLRAKDYSLNMLGVILVCLLDTSLPRTERSKMKFVRSVKTKSRRQDLWNTVISGLNLSALNRKDIRSDSSWFQKIWPIWNPVSVCFSYRLSLPLIRAAVRHGTKSPGLILLLFYEIYRYCTCIFLGSVSIYRVG